MPAFDPLVQSLLDATDAPQLLLAGRRIVAFNGAAHALIGPIAEGDDVSLSVRHPRALEIIDEGGDDTAIVRGIGLAEQEWRLTLRSLTDGIALLRLEDLSIAQSAERMRTDFVANASHELRTPLASIIGYAETLNEEGELSAPIRHKFGSEIEQEGRRMLQLVDELMSLSRISAERYVAPRGSVGLRDVVEKTVADHRDMTARAGAKVRLDVGDPLPDVAGDGEQIAQLASNLLSNALRYGGRDGRCEVAISMMRAGSMVRLTVTDEGEGIAAEHLPRLTERFYRVDPARSRDSGGTGLGLAIVKHIVERHRGALHIRSRVGEGTEVEVLLPAVTDR